VHGDRGLRVQNAVGFDGFLRRHVYWSHEPLRLETTNREQGETERVELRVDGGEVIAETCIAGKVNGPIGYSTTHPHQSVPFLSKGVLEEKSCAGTQ
jgi:hypothetical protein